MDQGGEAFELYVSKHKGARKELKISYGLVVFVHILLSSVSALVFASDVQERFANVLGVLIFLEAFLCVAGALIVQWRIRGSLAGTQLIKVFITSLLIGGGAFIFIKGFWASGAMLLVVSIGLSMGSLESNLDHLSFCQHIEGDVREARRGRVAVLRRRFPRKFDYIPMEQLAEGDKVRALEGVGKYCASTRLLYFDDSDYKAAKKEVQSLDETQHLLLTTATSEPLHSLT